MIRSAAALREDSEDKVQRRLRMTPARLVKRGKDAE